MEFAAFFAFILIFLLIVGGIPERLIDAWRDRGIDRDRFNAVERELEDVKQQLRRYERSVTPPRE